MMSDIEKAPSIGISYQVTLHQNRQLVLQSFAERDCERGALDALLDKLRAAAERQFAFGEVAALKLQLEQEQKIASDHAERMKVVDENIQREWANGGRRGDVRLSAKQEQEQRQAYANAEESKRRIAKVKADIETWQSKIGA